MAPDSPPASATPPDPWTLLNRLGQRLNQTLEAGAIAVDPVWLVAMATPPILGALASARAIGSALDQLGATSEELFRGDRLPVLHQTEAPTAHPPAPSPD
ncbi:MAG: hypothetical protein MH825_12090 [Cyanobacteria bacterium]|nr:hypothetical protein [Cyanobacteriota bacterium]